jgi:aldehyde dehydrogenase (NAD+)
MKQTTTNTSVQDYNKDKHKSLGMSGAWDYAPAPEKPFFEIKEKQQLFINGKFVDPISNDYFETTNPATEEVLSMIPNANAQDVDLAVKSARNAYESCWKDMPGKERAKYLFRIARMIQERSRELAILETMDGGKPIKESRDVDLPLVAQHFFYNAGWADKLDYAFAGKKVNSLGVAGQIIPWNFPLLMAAWKLAPALATGNTVVLKPAETTSLSALVLAEIIQESGLPDGVVNIITGAGATGAALTAHQDLNKIAFTGSTDVGKLIQKTAAQHDNDLKLTLELGGKGAHIIFDDAAIDQAIEGIVQGIYFNQGHVCCAGSRLLVQESIMDLVLFKLKERIKKIRVGDPLDKNTDLGAINSKEQYCKIKEMTQVGIDEGASLFDGAQELPNKGYFVKPTFFTNVGMSSRIAVEEIFGPVLSVMSFRTINEAIDKANNTPYGLSAGLWSQNSSLVLEAASKLRAGVVWNNTFNQFDAASPFGGMKESGYGREGGIQGLYPYVSLS